MSNWLKVDLHVHAKEDPRDNLFYSIKDYINIASKNKYDVLAVTFHDYVIDGKFLEETKKYAVKKRILIIPGCEAAIEGKHTLIYNITNAERKNTKTFDDLRKLKTKRKKQGKPIFVIAAHPYFNVFFITNCLGEKLVKNIDVFDAIEINAFYTKFINFNKKAIQVAKKYKKPLVGNGDIHHPIETNRTYSLINSQKDIQSIFNAIKTKKVKIISKPLNIFQLLGFGAFFAFKDLIGLFKRR